MLCLDLEAGFGRGGVGHTLPAQAVLVATDCIQKITSSKAIVKKGSSFRTVSRKVRSAGVQGRVWAREKWPLPPSMVSN